MLETFQITNIWLLEALGIQVLSGMVMPNLLLEPGGQEGSPLTHYLGFGYTPVTPNKGVALLESYKDTKI